MKTKDILHRTINFRDAKGSSCTVDVRVYAERNTEEHPACTHSENLDIVGEYKVLLVSGSVDGHLGQVRDRILPQDNAQQHLLDLWGQYHLNNMKVGTPAQVMALQDLTDYHNQEISELRDFLSLRGLDICLDSEGNEVSFGTRHLVRLLPADILIQINNTLDQIEVNEKEQGHLREEMPSQTDWGEIVDFRIRILASHLQLSPQDAAHIMPAGGYRYRYQDHSYLVMDPHEAYAQAHDILSKNGEWEEEYYAGETVMRKNVWAENELQRRGMDSVIEHIGGPAVITTDEDDQFLIYQCAT